MVLKMNGVTTVANASAMTNVTELAGTIQKMGAGVVAIAVIFMIFIIGVSVFLGMFKKILDDFIKTYGRMLNNILSPQQEKEDILKSSIEIAEEARKHLQYACGVTHCDRSAAYVFHNGTRTLGGSHLLKFSCLVEYSNIAQLCDGKNHQSTPIGEIWEACTDFLNSGLFTSWDVNALPEGSDVKAWMLSRNIRAAVAHAVYSDTGEVIGFVVTEYIKYPPPANSEQRIISATKDLANRMVMVMDLELIH